MAAYQYQNSVHHEPEKTSRTRRVFLGLLAFVVLAGIFATARRILSNTQSGESVSIVSTRSVRSASVSVFRSEYFQFEAPDGWELVDGQSTDAQFVYQKKDDRLVTERFMVFVDRPVVDTEADLSLTHVLPVRVVDGARIEHDAVSAHCRESADPDATSPNMRIVVNGASFVCNRSSEQYNIVVSEIDGDEGLEFVLSSGDAVQLTLMYSNRTVHPSTGDMLDIVSSFESL